MVVQCRQVQTLCTTDKFYDVAMSIFSTLSYSIVDNDMSSSIVFEAVSLGENDIATDMGQPTSACEQAPQSNTAAVVAGSVAVVVVVVDVCSY